MGALVLDANAAIGFLDPADGHHARAVEALTAAAARRDDLLMPVTAYAEMLVHPLRAGTDAGVERFVGRREVFLVPVDRRLARAAAGLRAAHASLRLSDAFVLATALEREAGLLTFDDRLRRMEAMSRP